MKKTVAILAVAISICTSAFAQDLSKDAPIALFESLKQHNTENALIQLSELTKYGNDTVGKHPKCIDIANIWDQVAKQTILAFYASQIPAYKDVLGSFPTHSYQYDLDSFYARLHQSSDEMNGEVLAVNNKPEKTSSSRSVSTSGISPGYCFVGETLVTIAYPDQNKQSGKQISFETLSEDFEDDSYNLHILSSNVDKLPGAPSEFHQACWGEVHSKTDGGVYDGEQICSFTYSVDGSSSYTCTSTENHRYYVEVTDESGNKTRKWLAAKDINLSSMDFITTDDTAVDITSQSTELVDNWCWPIFDFDNYYDLDVYNLSVETGTYYVGSTDNQILVHNVKP